MAKFIQVPHFNHTKYDGKNALYSASPIDCMIEFYPKLL